MTAEELQNKIEQLEKELKNLKDLFYKDSYSKLKVFKEDIILKGELRHTGEKVGFFDETPVVQADAIAEPAGAGDAGVDTPARTAINLIIAALKNIGITQ